MPGLRVIDDRGSAIAKQFGAATSGQVLVYDDHAQLRFSGGITAYRGHSGDNVGRDLILALERGQRTLLTNTPVFGCSLLDE
jgi:hypothetical protein